MKEKQFLLAKALVQGYIIKIESKNHSLDEILQDMKQDVAFLNGQIAINKLNNTDNNSHAHDRTI